MGFKENLRKQYLDKKGKKRGFWSWLWNTNPYLLLIMVIAAFISGFLLVPILLLVSYLLYILFKRIAFSNK